MELLKEFFSLRDLNLSQKHTFDRFFPSNFSKLLIMSEYFPSLQIDDFLQKKFNFECNKTSKYIQKSILKILNTNDIKFCWNSLPLCLFIFSEIGSELC